MQLIRTNFFNTLKENHSNIKGYKQLNYTPNNKILSDFEGKIDDNTILNKVISNMLFPSYLKPEFSNEPNTKIAIIPQKKITGYSILLKDSKNIEDFLLKEYNSRYRKEIRRHLGKFEACFNANYKMFFGKISKEDYDFLMGSLHNMLIRRFNQRNDKNKILENWDYYLKTTFSLINSKKASIYVIYDGTKPVQISFNFHIDKILFISITSYNIDYQKFSMGNNAIYKLLEWSIENGYNHVDMEYGYLHYKQKWSNFIYSYDQHVIFSKSSPMMIALAFVEIHRIKFKNLLKSLNIDDLIKKIKEKIKSKSIPEKQVTFEKEIIENLNTTQLNLIHKHENDEDYFKIKPAVFDFLYYHREHIDSIKIFKDKTNNSEYYLIGKTKTEKIKLH
ncbi:GNAT family N-acetyltransferase [Thalassobellus sediminis]|uniref:GNAT family N-acetyltransferase n=1 Tax=Thalassobellus sediminis TaxID=3367753 RepID=UPI003787AF43